MQKAHDVDSRRVNRKVKRNTAKTKGHRPAERDRWFAFLRPGDRDELLEAEALPILSRAQEPLNHFPFDVIAVERVQLIQPKVEAVEVQRRFGRCVRIPSQITKVLHHYKCAIGFAL